MASNPLATHLKQQRDRIANMLTPGAKDAPGRHLLFSAFGGQKFQIAAQKMRMLDPVRLGNLRPGQILRPLTGPARDAASLLHIKPATEGQPNPWSQVETVFPNLAAGESEPPRPGEMRAGSIIPRMPSVPKPGQSLESFKEQIQQRPKISPPPADIPRPRIDPKARLFSRVQEIPAKKPDDDTPGLPGEIETVQRQPDLQPRPAPVVDEKPAPKVEVAVEAETRSALPPVTSSPEPVAPRRSAPAPRADLEPEPRRVDDAPAPTPAPRPEPARPVLLPPAVKAVAPQASVPEPEPGLVPHPATPAAPARPAEPAPVQTASTSKTATPVARDEAARLQALPLARAVPLRVKETARPAPRPVARASKPTITPPLPQAPTAKPSTANVIQRTPDAIPAPKSVARPVPGMPLAPRETPPEIAQRSSERPVAPIEPARPVAARPSEPEAARPAASEDHKPEPVGQAAVEPPAPAQIDLPAPQPAAPVSQSSAPDAEAMPLHQRISYRRATPGALKIALPARLEPRRSLPKLTRSEKPLIAPNKYQPVAGETKLASTIQRQPEQEITSPAVIPPRAPGTPVLEYVRSPQPLPAQRGESESRRDSFTPAPPASVLPPMALSLAYPPRPVEKPVAPSAPAPAAQPSAASTVPAPMQQGVNPPAPAASQTLARPRPASVGNTIQRTWSEHEGLGGSQLGEGSQPSSSSEQSGTAQELDLEQLAEDVFPYVKRLIEIESDRLAGRFRS